MGTAESRLAGRDRAVGARGEFAERADEVHTETLGVGPIPGGCEVRTFGSQPQAFDRHGEVGGLPSGNGHVRTSCVNRFAAKTIPVRCFATCFDPTRTSSPMPTPSVLEVRIHTLANPRSNRAIQHLLDHLNATESTFPGTEFRLSYTLGEPENGVT